MVFWYFRELADRQIPVDAFRFLPANDARKDRRGPWGKTLRWAAPR
jgi:hypothetical protein